MKSATGVVKKEGHISSRFGFPTANMFLPKKGPSGVYAAKITIGDKSYNGVANICDFRTEAHIFDFSEDILGQTMTIEYLEKLRNLRSFSGWDDLDAQLQKDKKAARIFFGL